MTITLKTETKERFAHGKVREATVPFIACCKCEQSQAVVVSVDQPGFNDNPYLSVACNLCGKPYYLNADLMPTYTDDPAQAYRPETENA